MRKTNGPSQGVGRGNGRGSRRTQFEKGKPSANPAGRSRGLKSAGEGVDLRQSLQMALQAKVTVRVDGAQRKMLLADAMVRHLTESFFKASPAGLVPMMKLLFDLATVPIDERSREISPDAVNEFIAALIAEEQSPGA